MLSRISVLAFCLFALLGCKEEAKQKPKEPRGPDATEERSVAPFEGLEVPGPVRVVVKNGKTSKAKLSGPANYLGYVKLVTEKRQIAGKSVEFLVVNLKERVTLPRVTLEVSTPDLVYVHAKGSSQIELPDFSRESLTLRAEEASTITMEPGAYGKVDAEVSRVGRIIAKNVMIEEANLRAYGVGQIAVGQIGRLKKDEVKPAAISYSGRPELLQ